MAKVVDVTPVFNGSIYKLKFQTIPKRGWFTENVKPIVDLIKTQVPSSMRLYNPNTYEWEIDGLYYPAIELLLKNLGWRIKLLADKAAPVDVPVEYAESFHYEHTVNVPKESAESIAFSLGKILCISNTEFRELDESSLKKLYRQAARKYHPDFGGDPAQMSELNRLWTLYTSAKIEEAAYA